MAASAPSMFRYGLPEAIKKPPYTASRFSCSSPIASVGTHSNGSPTCPKASFVNRWFRFCGLKSPTTPTSTVMTRASYLMHSGSHQSLTNGLLGQAAAPHWPTADLREESDEVATREPASVSATFWKSPGLLV